MGYTFAVRLWGPAPRQVHPWLNLFFLSVIFVFAMGIGLLPYIDNYTHIGGFAGGLLAGSAAALRRARACAWPRAHEPDPLARSARVRPSPWTCRHHLCSVHHLWQMGRPP